MICTAEEQVAVIKRSRFVSQGVVEAGKEQGLSRLTAAQFLQIGEVLKVLVISDNIYRVGGTLQDSNAQIMARSSLLWIL